MFKLSIELGNAAMQTPEDVAHALHEVIVALDVGRTEGKIRDENGNTVGTWSFKA